jgi:hypothetical protein
MYAMYIEHRRFEIGYFWQFLEVHYNVGHERT